MLNRASLSRSFFGLLAVGLFIFGESLPAQADQELIYSYDDEPEWVFDGDLPEQIQHNAGVLAVRESTEIFANPAVVETFSEDLAQIYAAYPGLAAARARSGNSFSIVVEPEPDVEIESILEGFPSGWVVEARESYSGQWFTLHFNQRINCAAMSEWVGTFPGVANASSNYFFGDGADLYYHEGVSLFAFRLGWGDCFAGCYGEKWRFVVVTASGPQEIEMDAALDLLDVRPRSTVRPLIRAHESDRLIIPDTITGPEFAVSLLQQSGHGTVWGEYRIGIGKLGEDDIPSQHLFFELVDRGGSPALSGLRLPSGWLWHEEFGWLWDQSYPWVWHAQHGWLYAGSEDDAHGLWLFDTSLGWSFWDERLYPWIYTSSGWLLYTEGTSQPRRFYAPETGQAIEVDSVPSE